MKFMVEYLLFGDPEWADPGTLAEYVRTAEAVGIDAVGFGEHPAPSRRWLDGGGLGHFDPFVAIGYAAAITTRIQLMTHVAVVPYRPALALAKLIADVDVLSGGRVAFILGSGYLRPEFRALGVNFDRRNELFDEAIEVCMKAWADGDLNYDGHGFRAHDHVLIPKPVQRPHPPLWLGGNSSSAIERAATWGSGWAPLRGSALLARTTRTPVITSEEELRKAIARLGERLQAHGRTLEGFDVMVACDSTPLTKPDGAERCLEELGRLQALGVTWCHIHLPRAGATAALDGLRQFGETVLPLARDM